MITFFGLSDAQYGSVPFSTARSLHSLFLFRYSLNCFGTPFTAPSSPKYSRFAGYSLDGSL
ncbi:MAG: hypothetical protein LBS42_02550 [Tannerella sp.]|nr:hypothetical protein [Tannerella sp.]